MADREFTVDAETLATMEAMKKRFGVSTNAEVLKCALAEARAALSTPVPEEGLPRGSASAAEGEPVAWFYEFLGHNDQWIADVRLAKPKAPSGGAIRNVRPLSFASAFPSPLPSQGEPVAEPVAWMRRNGGHTVSLGVTDTTLYRDIWRRDGFTVVPLYTAEALAAERARADSLKAERDAEADIKWQHHEMVGKLAKRVLDAEARADRAEEALKPFAEAANGFDYGAKKGVPDRFHILAGLTVGDLRRARAVLRARSILKETPHDER